MKIFEEEELTEWISWRWLLINHPSTDQQTIILNLECFWVLNELWIIETTLTRSQIANHTFSTNSSIKKFSIEFFSWIFHNIFYLIFAITFITSRGIAATSFVKCFFERLEQTLQLCSRVNRKFHFAIKLQ